MWISADDLRHQSIGVIGLGLLGIAIAQRLRINGFAVAGFDTAEERKASLIALGGKWFGSSSDVAVSCEIVLLCLPDSNTARQVVEQMLSRLLPGSIVMDATTGDPQSTTDVAVRLERFGITYVDTTVVGSSQQVSDGQAAILLGCGEKDRERLQPILQAIAPQVFHVGDVGTAAKMKLVVNLAIGLHRAVLAEALTLAKVFGIEGSTALSVMKATSAYSRMMDSKGEKMLTGDFTPQARVSQHLKDVRLMLAAASQAKIALPLSQVNEKLLASLVAAGLGELDNSAIMLAYEGLE